MCSISCVLTYECVWHIYQLDFKSSCNLYTTAMMNTCHPLRAFYVVAQGCDAHPVKRKCVNGVVSPYSLYFSLPDVIVGGPEPPYPLNNNNVTLNCSTSLEGNIIWSVNEFQLNTEMRLAIWEAQGVIIQNLQPTLSIITIRSRLHLNNTRFRCEVEGPRVIDGIIGVSNLINFTYYGKKCVVHYLKR